MSAQEPTPAQPALSEQEMEALDNFLMSDATSSEVMMLDQLDGFFTALASGPSLPEQDAWMPRVWGPSASDAPKFSNDAQQETITDLLTRHLNATVWSMNQELESFEPIFDLNVYEGDEHEYMDGENWAHGYMTGIALQRNNWKKLLEARHAAEVLRPLYLLGSPDITEEEEALIETPAQREALSKTIPASVAAIYKYWAPQRRAADNANGDAEDMPKNISRNAPCPCGSGRKFKKCCGAGKNEA
ncbi:MAG: UPF0149 family protein [Sideroxydans sp.]|nr:UPF0149 family protein [Sideroxydans sp.]